MKSLMKEDTTYGRVVHRKRWRESTDNRAPAKQNKNKKMTEEIDPKIVDLDLGTKKQLLNKMI